MHPANTPCKHSKERAGCTAYLHLAYRPYSNKTREVIHCRKKYSLPQSYSTRVNEANQIHVHKLQGAPKQTQISCTLSTRIQQKNRFKLTEKLFEISRKIVQNQPKYCLKSIVKFSHSNRFENSIAKKATELKNQSHFRLKRPCFDRFSRAQKTKTIFKICNQYFRCFGERHFFRVSTV